MSLKVFQFALQFIARNFFALLAAFLVIQAGKVSRKRCETWNVTRSESSQTMHQRILSQSCLFLWNVGELSPTLSSFVLGSIWICSGGTLHNFTIFWHQELLYFFLFVVSLLCVRTLQLETHNPWQFLWSAHQQHFCSHLLQLQWWLELKHSECFCPLSIHHEGTPKILTLPPNSQFNTVQFFQMLILFLNFLCCGIHTFETSFFVH